MMPIVIRRSISASMAGVAGVAPVLKNLELSAIAQANVPAQPPVRLSLAQAALEATSMQALVVQNFYQRLHTQRNSQPAARRQSKADPTPLSSPSSSTRQVQVPTSAFVRVRVSSNPNQLVVAASTSADLLDGNGQAIARVMGQQAYPVQLGQDGLLLGEQSAPNGFFINPGPDGLVMVGGHWYRGLVQVVYDGQNLMAVNWVDLEQYLYAVVGAEMPPSWNLEALKAQAIAARSYAAAHINQPSNEYFDLGNDQRWQVYRGVETEVESIIAAVEGTRGSVLAKNQQVFMAQYASTDELSQTQGGPGSSLSQYGAGRMASQGATAKQILAHYYAGSELSILGN